MISVQLGGRQSAPATIFWGTGASQPSEQRPPDAPAKGRTGAGPGPRKEANAGRNVTQGVVRWKHQGYPTHANSWHHVGRMWCIKLVRVVGTTCVVGCGGALCW